MNYMIRYYTFLGKHTNDEIIRGKSYEEAHAYATDQVHIRNGSFQLQEVK